MGKLIAMVPHKNRGRDYLNPAKIVDMVIPLIEILEIAKAIFGPRLRGCAILCHEYDNRAQSCNLLTTTHMSSCNKGLFDAEVG